MKKLLEFIAKGIVDHPNKIVIEEKKNESSAITQLILATASDDMGKIIGKKGKIIQAIRSLLKVKATIKNQKVFLSLKES